MDSISTMKNVEEIPEQGLTGDAPLETIQNLPNLSSRDAMSLRNFITNFTPTGFKVVVNLPYVPNAINSLFGIVHTPFYPPIVPKYDNLWLAIKNAFRPILFDPVPDGAGPTDVSYGLCPAGISIVQYQDPNMLSLLSSCHRFWSGTINYQIRVVCNFITTGYIQLTKLRNIVVPMSHYNQYAVAPIIKSGNMGMLQAMQNSYIRADLSMFRHMEFSCPYERPIPVDMDLYTKERIDTVLASNTDSQVYTYSDDIIMVYAGTPLTAVAEGAQIEFIIENCAGPDFQLFTPLIPFTNTFIPISKLEDGIPGGTSPYRGLPFPDVMPNADLISDGIKVLTPVS